jgi:hypothetical protein
MTEQFPTDTEVRSYPDERAFRQESDALARDGWEVVRIAGHWPGLWLELLRPAVHQTLALAGRDLSQAEGLTHGLVLQL